MPGAGTSTDSTAAPGAAGSDTTIVYPARRILTMDPSQPTVEAVAVREGRILAAGSHEECASWGPHTVDDRFRDHILTPGMIEAHGHSMAGAFSLFPYVGWFDRPAVDGGVRAGVRSYSDLVERLRQIDSETAGSDEPIFVGGFDPIYFEGEERLTRHHLDAASETRPIFVMHASSHLATVNTAMLRTHDITRDTATPGVARDAEGEPNGELQEMPAMSLASSAIGQFFRAIGDPQAITNLGQICANQGITTLVDLAAVGLMLPDTQAVWTGAVENPAYPARVFQRHLAARPPGTDTWEAAADAFVELRRSSGDRLRSVGIKVILDGSIQGFTAKMDWPGYYTGHDHGVWMTPPEQMLDMCQPFHDRKVNIHTHCNGDLTIDLWLDTVEDMVMNTAWLDHRHTVQHCQLTKPAQYRRMRALGMCANIFTNHIWFWGDQHHDVTVGPERARRMEACATAERLGVPFSIHSDADVTPLGHLHTMWCAVNRVTPSGRVLGEDERISAQSALGAVTLGAAYQIHHDDELGSLECGKAADLTVLEDDPLEVDPMAIRDIGVWGTLVGGTPFAANRAG